MSKDYTAFSHLFDAMYMVITDEPELTASDIRLALARMLEYPDCILLERVRLLETRDNTTERIKTYRTRD